MIQIGDKKVTKMIVGGNTLINRDDAWLECAVGPSFVLGTPILMRYDSTTGITTLLGQSYFKTQPKTNFELDEDILTLPDGYHFTEIDSNFPFGWGSGTYYPSSLSLTQDNILHAQYSLGSGSDSINNAIQMCFGRIFSANSTMAEVWQTTTIASD